MLDVSIQGGCILPADDPLWNQSAHCQGAYGHGFRSYVFRVYNIWLCRYAGLPNKMNHCRDGCPQDVQPNQPRRSQNTVPCVSRISRVETKGRGASIAVAAASWLC